MRSPVRLCAAKHIGSVLIASSLLVGICAADSKLDTRRAHDTWHKALRDADSDVLRKILDDQFTWVHTDGTVETKADLINRSSNTTRYSNEKVDLERISEYGNSAVITGRSSGRCVSGTKQFDTRYTLTLVKRGSDWKVAAYQTATSASEPAQSLQVRLGYPPDAKLLILNADDLAVTHSENVASMAALNNKLITSATVMVPCPWFTEVAAYAKAHPEADLGLHLTLTSEWKTFRWGPIASRALVPSLVGPDGYFYASTAEVAQHARLEDVETEIRAQIERALSMGLHPSHLDAHMHALYATPELFRVFLKVAHEYKLPIRMARNEGMFQPLLPLIPPGDPIPDAIFSPGEDVAPSRWNEYYVDVFNKLQPGVTEVFVHLAHDDAETQAVMVDHPEWGAAWRQREFEAVSSPAFREALQQNHVTLIGWRDIKNLSDGRIGDDCR